MIEEVFSLLQETSKNQQYSLRKALDNYNEEKSSWDELTLPYPDDPKQYRELYQSDKLELINKMSSTCRLSTNETEYFPRNR